MKQTIKITENELKKIVKNSIKTVLTEGAWGYGILDNDAVRDKLDDFCKETIVEPLEKLKETKDGGLVWEIVGIYEFIIENLLMKDGELKSIMQESQLLGNLEEMLDAIENDKNG